MAGLGSLVVELSANIAKFESAMYRANYLTVKNMRQITESIEGVNTSIENLPRALLKLASTLGVFYGLQRAIRGTVATVDEFRVSVIGIAATLTDMAESNQGSMESIYKRNEEHAKKMYRAISLESAKHFATANEGMMVYNRLVQSGYSVRLDEVNAVLLLTDKIKLATKGQDAAKQLNTEIMALMSGQVRQGSMLAMELQSRLGPGWKDLVARHKEAGTLLQWITDLFPGLQVANKAIEGTLNAQWATLKSILEIISIGGLADAYDSIVGFVRDIAKFLKDHEEMINGGIKRGWQVVSDLAGGFVGVLKEIYKILVDSVEIMAKFTSFWLGLGRSGPWYKGAQWLASGEGIQALSGGAFGGTGTDLGFIGPPAPGTTGITGGAPKIKTAAGTIDTKGAARAAAAADRIRAIIDTLEKDFAKFSEGSIAEVDAWADKMRNEIEKIGRKGADVADALVLVDRVAALKKEKIAEDFSLFVAKASGDTYKVIEAEANENLRKYKGIADAQVEINNIKNRKLRDEDIKNEKEVERFQREYYEGMAAITLEIQDQYAWKKKVLDLDIRRSVLDLEENIKRRGKALPKETADDMRKFNTLANSTKRFRLEWEQAAEESKRWASFLGNIASGFMGLIQGVATGTMTLVAGISNFLQMIADSILQMILTITMKWAESQMMMAATSGAASAATTSVEVGNAAVVGAAKAQAAYAHIPWVGMAIGLAAAAAMMAVIMALKGSIKSSAGGLFEVPGTSMGILHKEETVLPAWAAKSWRDIVARGSMPGGGPGENGTIINVTHAPTYMYRATESDYKRDARMIVKAINQEIGTRGQKLGNGRS